MVYINVFEETPAIGGKVCSFLHAYLKHTRQHLSCPEAEAALEMTYASGSTERSEFLSQRPDETLHFFRLIPGTEKHLNREQ